MIAWNQLDTLLLDLDGTLLDLHYDNHFWLDHVPRRYAETHGLSPEAAREEVLGRYQRAEGTLNWYCVDYWSRELRLDIGQLLAVYKPDSKLPEKDVGEFRAIRSFREIMP